MPFVYLTGKVVYIFSLVTLILYSQLCIDLCVIVPSYILTGIVNTISGEKSIVIRVDLTYSESDAFRYRLWSVESTLTSKRQRGDLNFHFLHFINLSNCVNSKG